MANVDRSIYQTPLTGRYASKEMKHLFSDDVKFSYWRKLWVALAEAEQATGLVDISDEQIDEMRAHIYDINYDVAEAREKEVRHDVMAHVYAYGEQCPKAKGIIHLGATSCYVTDNTDILIYTDALCLVRKRLLGVIKLLADFANKYMDMPCLGYTHYQPASPVTVGKRATLWIQNFMENLEDLEHRLESIKLLGCRGATGTQETFMELMGGDFVAANSVEEYIADQFDFYVYPVSGQTYPRNLDEKILHLLSEIATSAYKMANDIRLMQHDKEVEEPFGKNQIGSSAMAYKRNPMRCERICSLARHVQTLSMDATQTASVQWLERTLDDSANRRICMPEAFLGIDAILIICGNVADGLVVNDKVIHKHLMEELPFMATEPILMEAVKKGGDRQELHERIRKHSMEASEQIKKYGKPNDLVDRIANDSAFGMSKEEILKILDPSKLTGRAAAQTKAYLEDTVYRTFRFYYDELEDIDTNVEV